MHVFAGRFMAPDDTRTRPTPASAAMYREVQAALGLQRVVVVQANAYGSDNRGMLEAMATLGAAARGVAQPAGGHPAKLRQHAVAMPIQKEQGEHREAEFRRDAPDIAGQRLQ